MPSGVMLSKAEGPALEGPPITVYEMMKTASSKYPNNPALVSMHQRTGIYCEICNASQSRGDYLRWSHSQFRRGAELLAVALNDLGLQKGEPVAVFLDNVAEWSLILYATLLLNVPFVDCNPRSAPNAEEIRHVLKTSGACALIATDEALARQLEEAAPAEMKSMRCRVLLGIQPKHLHFVTGTDSSYHYLDGLLAKAANQPDIHQRLTGLETVPREPDDTVIILFTSGTTSLPKGCAHTNRTFTSCLRSYIASLNIAPESRMVMNHAVNTISGPLFNFSFLTSGATVVHPSLHFDAAASIRAVQLEDCSHMGTVTTMLQLCLEHPSLPSTDVSSLKIVFCGGSNVLYSHATKTNTLMGAKLRIIYALTEAPGTTNGYAEMKDEPESSETDRGTPSTGPPAPGVKIRICDPSTGQILARGERGELHQSGPLIISQYIGNASPESFYEEADELWFRTGDEAVMDAEGEIRITGRFKDLILRGGANLSPAIIENIISRELGLDSQVIGISDEIAGEVPLAIIKADDNQQQHLSAVRQTVIRKLGKNYALGDVVLLKDLGLDDWPKTTSGKVRKTELRDLVDNRIASTDHKDDRSNATDVAAIIKDTWNALTGVPVQEIEDGTSVNELADSLTISRLATQLQKAVGQTVSLQDLLENPTLGEQVKMLQSRKENPLSDLITTRASPPTANDMIHTHGQEDRASKTKELCEPALQKLGLSWSEDVKDVLPVYDWARTNLRFDDTYASGEISQIHVSNNATVSQLSKAVETALEATDIMRTLVIRFDDETVLFVVLRPSDRWYRNCFKVLSEPLETVNDLKQLEVVRPGPWAQPLVRVTIAFVKETSSAALSVRFSHATGDGISWGPFFSIVEATLRDEKHKPPPKVPYKVFADEMYAFRSSIRAQALVSRYATALKGIRTRTKIFWPPSIESYWFHGRDWSESTKNAPKGFAKKNERCVQPHDRKAGDFMTTRNEVELRDIRELQTSHGVLPSVLGKAALMLFAATQTQQTHVFLGEILSGRNSWPTAQWVSNRLPSPLDIDGPVYTSMPYSLDIDRDMKVMDLLQQMTKDHARLVEDNHLPTFTLQTALNEADDGAAVNYRDGDVMANGMRRLIMNWLPVIADPAAGTDQERAMTCVHNVVETRMGASMLMGLKADGKTLSVRAVWGDVALDDQEKDDAVKNVVEMARKLCAKQSWERSVGEVTEK